MLRSNRLEDRLSLLNANQGLSDAELLLKAIQNRDLVELPELLDEENNWLSLIDDVDFHRLYPDTISRTRYFRELVANLKKFDLDCANLLDEHFRRKYPEYGQTSSLSSPAHNQHDTNLSNQATPSSYYPNFDTLLFAAAVGGTIGGVIGAVFAIFTFGASIVGCAAIGAAIGAGIGFFGTALVSKCFNKTQREILANETVNDNPEESDDADYSNDVPGLALRRTNSDYSEKPSESDYSEFPSDAESESDESLLFNTPVPSMTTLSPSSSDGLVLNTLRAESQNHQNHLESIKNLASKLLDDYILGKKRLWDYFKSKDKLEDKIYNQTLAETTKTEIATPLKQSISNAETIDELLDKIAFALLQSRIARINYAQEFHETHPYHYGPFEKTLASLLAQIANNTSCEQIKRKCIRIELECTSNDADFQEMHNNPEFADHNLFSKVSDLHSALFNKPIDSATCETLGISLNYEP